MKGIEDLNIMNLSQTDEDESVVVELWPAGNRLRRYRSAGQWYYVYYYQRVSPLGFADFAVPIFRVGI